MSLFNQDGAAGTLAAMQAAAHAEPDADEAPGHVDPVARLAAEDAHSRLDGHADVLSSHADMLGALAAHTGLAEPDSDESAGAS